VLITWTLFMVNSVTKHTRAQRVTLLLIMANKAFDTKFESFLLLFLSFFFVFFCFVFFFHILFFYSTIRKQKEYKYIDKPAELYNGFLNDIFKGLYGIFELWNYISAPEMFGCRFPVPAVGPWHTKIRENSLLFFFFWKYQTVYFINTVISAYDIIDYNIHRQPENCLLVLV
jgi:hypothetical protein